MNIVKWVIFDFDGVVADTETVFAHFDCGLLNDVLSAANAEERVTFQDLRAMAGYREEDKLASIARRFNLDLSPYEQEFLDKRNAARKTLFRDNPVPLGKNLEPFLSTLNGRYALGTNKLASKLLPDMKIMNISDLFAVVVTCEPPLRKKPAPDVLLEAASRLGATPEECAYVGDNMIDLEAAKAANMQAVGFVIEGKNTQPQRVKDLQAGGADIVIDDFMDLRPYVV